jgi:endonuclease/exonuclease/phosphatase family metal-dependent hydrolase
MKKIPFILIFLLAFQYTSSSQDLNFITYNLRYDNTKDGENSWSNRKEFLLSQIKYNEPDVLGIQEGLIQQVKWLDENLEHFNYVGRGRNESEDSGEFSAIFYNKEKFDVCTPPSERIDYIFTNNKISVKKYAVLCDIKDMRYPSDHFPVIIKANF